ncbi:hypothetical protein [Tianweitania sp.]|uniref:hypothetical protein n=1 Tax=Tianweitania sp. TaxID=2021634 RepID=UPI00289E32E9|nr:hypothetical protein [Tianweitania sp.]
MVDLEQANRDAFETYKEAKAKLDVTMKFEDAMVAKRAYWRFLHILDEHCPGTNVIPLRRPNTNIGGAA